MTIDDALRRMSGSSAERRIRAKAEALLRSLFPDARIVHELVLRQGGERIDIAAIRPGYIAALEIKSERDVLKRLPEQVSAALRVCDLFGVCVAEKHEKKIIRAWEAGEDDGVLRLPWDAHLLIESDHGFTVPRQCPFDAECGLRGRIQPRPCNPWDLLEMLWAEELKMISGTNYPRQKAKALIFETMTGAQIRQSVCGALRRRKFPAADPAIEEVHDGSR